MFWLKSPCHLPTLIHSLTENTNTAMGSQLPNQNRVFTYYLTESINVNTGTMYSIHHSHTYTVQVLEDPCSTSPWTWVWVSLHVTTGRDNCKQFWGAYYVNTNCFVNAKHVCCPNVFQLFPAVRCQPTNNILVHAQLRSSLYTDKKQLRHPTKNLQHCPPPATSTCISCSDGTLDSV